MIVNTAVLCCCQALTEVLSRVVEENERRVMEGRPSCVRLQCLRCGSEFIQRGGKEQEDGGRLRGWTGLEEQQQEDEWKNKCREDGLGERGTLVQEHGC